MNWGVEPWIDMVQAFLALRSSLYSGVSAALYLAMRHFAEE